METDIPEEWKQYPLASDFIEYEFNKVYLRKGRDGILMPWTWSRNAPPAWKRGIRGRKRRNWKKLLEEKAKEKNIEIISIIIRKQSAGILVIGDEIMFADIKKIPNGRCMCKFKCPCENIDIKIVRDICYGIAYFECHNCSEQQRRKDIQGSHLNFSDDKKADIIKKREEANIKKRGYPYPMQNSEVARKCMSAIRKIKIYKYPSGREDKVEGYEPQCLNDLIHNEGICEKDIITDRMKVPEIWWEDEDGVRHRHYVDIFIISQNKCIEVKSDFILKKRTKGAYKKQKAGKKLGYEYEIRVYNEKGDIIEMYN